jgi:hypothetical protein
VVCLGDGILSILTLEACQGDSSLVGNVGLFNSYFWSFAKGLGVILYSQDLG